MNTNFLDCEYGRIPIFDDLQGLREWLTLQGMDAARVADVLAVVVTGRARYAERSCLSFRLKSTGLIFAVATRPLPEKT